MTTRLDLLNPGDSFFSIQNHQARALSEITTALQKGARQVFSYHRFLDRHHCQVKHSSQAKLLLVQDFYDKYWSRIKKVKEIGITGTNGKTSVAHLMQSALNLAGQKWASLGTMGLVLPGKMKRKVSFSLTSPDVIDRFWSKAYLVDQGYDGLICEESSHGLFQERNLGSHYDATIATSITLDDHLDYHKTEQSYLKAKAKLFNLYDSCYQIVHFDNPIIPYIQKKNYLTLIPYRDLFCAQSIREAFHFNHLDLVRTYLSKTGLSLHSTDSQIIANSGLIGRMQGVSWNRHRDIFIDYAHTPKALEYVLKILSGFYNDRELWVIFGCGGDRDKFKRKKMFEVVAKFADRVIITEDNNRSEQFSSIVQDMLSGATDHHLSKTKVIEKREQAILELYQQAPNSTVGLIAGKGHETYQDSRFSSLSNSDFKQVQYYAAL